MNEPVDGKSVPAEMNRGDLKGPTRSSGAETCEGLSDLGEQLTPGDENSEAGLVELLCSDQLNRWRAGERIPAEAYLARHPTLHGDGESAFELVYGEYLVRESLGETPKPEELCWRFPRFAERLRRQLDLHRALGDPGPAAEPASAPGSQGNDPDEHLAAVGPVLPGYEILRELGRGGMSVVYQARQVGLNRLVALKVINAKVYADVEIAARFRDEAEAAARFQHPNLTHVYEVGEFEGQGYLALEYAAGGSLQQKLAGTPQPPRESAQLVAELARAIHYAHQRGIVHRDLKPANVVLTDDGVPKVTDFGLAKLMEREGGMTRTGDIMGTPSYMAPEQARGTSADVTPATDIYSLGAILYEMLTGRPPFKGATSISTLNQVATQEPLPPGRLQRHTPNELETICLKCLEKEPRKRYATALDLADDLGRFLEDRPIRARRISRAEWLWRWCRREPAKAGLMGALLVVLVTGFVGVAAQWRRAEDKARAESRARSQAELAEGKARDNLYFSRIAQARLEWRLNNAAGAEQLLDLCEPERRGWEWNYLRNMSHCELFGVDLPELTYISSVVFSPDGKRFAFTGFDPYNDRDGRVPSPVEVWDRTTRRRLRRFVGPTQTMRLSFGPDGRLLAASGPRGAKVWDSTTGQEVSAWAPGGSLTFSPDGRYLASGGDHGVTFWDAATGREVRRFLASKGRVSFGADGQVLAISGPDAVELRAVTTGREIHRLPHGTGESEARQERFFREEGPELAFSPDGKHLVVATSPPRVWDAATGQPLYQLGGHAGAVPGVAISPDGRRVATAGVDSTIRLWDTETGAERGLLRGHAAWVECVAFDPEGWCLASGGRHAGQVKLWDLTRHQEYASLPRASSTALVFDADGSHLSLVTPEGVLQTRTTESGSMTVGARVDLSQQWQTPAVIADYSADGHRLVTVADDRFLVKVWAAETGRELATLRGLAASATYVACSGDGGRIAAAGLSKTKEGMSRDVKVWDTGTGQVLARFTPAPGPTRHTHGRVAMSSDGGRLAFDDYDDSTIPTPGQPGGRAQTRIRVCEVPSGRELLNLPVGESILFCVAFSSDGRMLAAGDEDGKVLLWDAQTGSVLHETRRTDRAFRLAFSPDGRRLAAVDREKVQMWNARDGQEVLILGGAPPRAQDGGFNPTLAWSSDGRRLASFNWDSSISIWDGSEQLITPADRCRRALDRVFLWHLSEAEAAVGSRQGIAAAFHLAKLSGREPPDVTSRLRRARLSLRFGRWERAGDDYEVWSKSGEPDQGEAWLSYARVLMMRGDGDGYRRLRARMLDRFEKEPHQLKETHVVRAFGLAECTSAEAARLVRLAERQLAEERRYPVNLYALALAHFRAEQWELAGDGLRESMEKGPGWAWHCWPLMAMVHHRLGHAEEARSALAKASERLAQEHTPNEGSTSSFVEEEGLDFQVLCREAASLIKRDASPQPPPDAEYVRKMIPAKISGTYLGGQLVVLRVHGRNAYIIKPTGKIDPQKRWVWIFPFWLGVNDGHGRLHHQLYVEKYLAAGFHVTGIDVGTSCGSPTAAEVCNEFYQKLRTDHGLDRRARLEVQSNGGLIGYAWAFRHPDCVDRIGGICPVTDFRTWPPPGMASILSATENGLGYNLTLAQLTARQAEFNPIENLAPLAKAGVKILHIHGDKDDLVPMPANSIELARRYQALGGRAEVVVIPGLGHGGQVLYESQPLLKFLLAD
ncbi:MAG: protein kinase [Isosphaerales bacterium]